MVEEKTFHKMFKPLNKKAPEIINVDCKSICEVVMLHGRLAKKATWIEMEGQELAWTTDHWTGRASWDNIAKRTEGGMGTVQIITSIVMLSLLLMVSSTWGN